MLNGLSIFWDALSGFNLSYIAGMGTLVFVLLVILVRSLGVSAEPPADFRRSSYLADDPSGIHTSLHLGIKN